MFLDIGAGIILSFLVGTLLDVEISSMWILCGVAFALLPDIDMVWYAVQRFIQKKLVDDHRSFTHYPILYVPASFVVYYYFGFPYALLFSLCIFFHFIHDTLWLGWGISWFAPFSMRKWKMFPDRDGKISKQVVMTWTPEEEGEVFKRYHNKNWVRDFYFRPNIVAYVEYSVFIFSIVLLCIYF